MHTKYFCLAPFQVLGKCKPYTILLLYLFVGPTGVRGLKRSNRYAYFGGMSGTICIDSMRGSLDLICN